MRGTNEDARPVSVNNTLETINAAASAIVAAENRVPQSPAQKKRWGSCLSICRCFGYRKNRKRIGHAVLVHETTASGVDATVTAGANASQAVTITLPFVAPPSSPASFLQSEPPSVAQSPTGILSLTSVSASMYSPSGPASIFAIGPYAHETQLVSPPVFSTFTTEPSTAPFTPPPESVHLTTPSSPEVPFAQLLDPNLRNGETFQRFQVSHHDFHSYQLHPGSPVGQLISPRSGISASGASSPLPDYDFNGGGTNIHDFQAEDPPKLLNSDKLATYENLRSHQGSGSRTPEAMRSANQGDSNPNYWVSEIRMHPNPNSNRHNENIINNRVSFELSAQLLRHVEKKQVTLSEAVSKYKIIVRTENEENSREIGENDLCCNAETRNDARTPQETIMEGDEVEVHQQHQCINLASAKEFNFDNADGGDSHTSNIVADWWANEKVAGKEGGPSKQWSFFPMIQPGVS